MPPESRNKKKLCSFCSDKVKIIDYKDFMRLRRYLTESGKILPRRITGTCSHHQRDLGTSVKRCRQSGLIPYVIEG